MTTTIKPPPECKTIFVSGYPNSVLTVNINDMFQRLIGEVEVIRRDTKKTFCYVRFKRRGSVDKALLLNGWWLRLLNVNEDHPGLGQLFIDPAKSRDDDFQKECKRREKARRKRHKVSSGHVLAR